MTEAQVTALTGSVDFATIIIGLAAIGAALILPMVAKKGISMILSMIR